MSSILDVDVAVVGAGVVGLASAARLVEDDLSVMVLERHPGPGRETSSRNSEVIHAGIYYPRGSLKARLCVLGNRLLYSYCEEHGVAFRRIGKVIVATSADEIGALEDLRRNGAENGAEDLAVLDSRDLRRLEPEVRAVAGLFSPSTGIVDSHGLVKSLEARARARGGQVAYRSRVVAVEPRGPGFRITVENPSGAEQLGARVVVNAAGLDADLFAAMAGASGYVHHWCKGDYFSVSSRRAASVRRLIYPLPTTHHTGLGIHITLDLAGRMRLGPDATYLERREQTFDVDPGKANAFLEAARRYLPLLTDEDLAPDLAGIRPRLQGPGEPFRDFVIRNEEDRGLPGLINLVGIESPGLTSCLAIAQEVAGLVGRHF